MNTLTYIYIYKLKDYYRYYRFDYKAQFLHRMVLRTCNADVLVRETNTRSLRLISCDMIIQSSDLKISARNLILAGLGIVETQNMRRQSAWTSQIVNAGGGNAGMKRCVRNESAARRSERVCIALFRIAYSTRILDLRRKHCDQ